MDSSGLTSSPSDVRAYSPEENRRLTTNLLDVSARVMRGETSERPTGLELLQYLHASIFEGVRGHAGRHRARDFGSEHLVFGPHRSSHRSEVEPKLRDVFTKLARKLLVLRDHVDDDGYEESCVETAIWAHAEVIRIHPFEDGNGRSSRLLMSHVLVSLGLRPIPVEACKQEYLESLNHYFLQGEIEPLVALFARIYPLD